MMKKAFIITARTPSTRLPSKIIKKIYKNKRTIDLLIERAKKVDLPIILATTKNSEDDFLCNYVKKKHNIKVFRGNYSKAKRWYDCFTKFNNSKDLTLDRSNRWHLDITVTGIFFISVVANINFKYSGGSSSVLSKALNACLLSI